MMNREGTLIGYTHWNHDGTSTTTKFGTCAHTPCDRPCDTSKDTSLCVTCLDANKGRLLATHESTHPIGESRDEGTNIGTSTSCINCSNTSQLETAQPTTLDASPTKNQPSSQQDHHRALHTKMSDPTIIQEKTHTPSKGNVPRKSVSERDEEYILNEWTQDTNIIEVPSENVEQVREGFQGMVMEASSDTTPCIAWCAPTDNKRGKGTKRLYEPIRASNAGRRSFQNASKWFAKCSTKGCPCTASFDGQDNQACSMACKMGRPCKSNRHYYPARYPRATDKNQPLESRRRMMIRMREERAIMAKQARTPQRTTPRSYHASYCGSRGDPRPQA